MKSYMADELKKYGSEFRARTKSMVRFTQALFKGVDEWDYNVLQLQEALIERETTRGRDGRTPSLSLRAIDVASSPADRNKGDEPQPQALSILGVHLFDIWGVSDKFGVDLVSTTDFLEKIEQRYNMKPYHNSMHGADVMR